MLENTQHSGQGHANIVILFLMQFGLGQHVFHHIHGLGFHLLRPVLHVQEYHLQQRRQVLVFLQEKKPVKRLPRCFEYDLYQVEYCLHLSLQV